MFAYVLSALVQSTQYLLKGFRSISLRKVVIWLGYWYFSILIIIIIMFHKTIKSTLNNSDLMQQTREGKDSLNLRSTQRTSTTIDTDNIANES